jgi:hypothetical protein
LFGAAALPEPDSNRRRNELRPRFLPAAIPGYFNAHNVIRVANAQ